MLLLGSKKDEIIAIIIMYWVLLSHRPSKPQTAVCPLCELSPWGVSSQKVEGVA